MDSPVASSSVNPTGQPGAKKRAGRTRLGRPTRSVIAGRLTWLRCLVRDGRMADAAAFHRKHGLHRYGATVPTVPTADTANGITATDTRTGSTDTARHAAGPVGPDSGSANHGGAGGSQRLGRENWDKTTPAVQNSQCSPLATATDVPLAVEADLTRLAAKAAYTPTFTPPAGESEGERGFGQAESMSGADNVRVTDKIVSVWPEGGEAIVGKLCRNKQYNELRVVGEDGREMWTKVGNWSYQTGLIRGERVLVRKFCGSGDDTDAEYEVVKRLDVNEPAEERRAESGSDSGSESVAPVVADESAIREQQTPKAILPQFQREEPDYPRKQESGEDYIARIRAEAAMWANGQGR